MIGGGEIKIKKYRIRYPASVIFFVVGIFVACIALFDLVGIYSDLQNQKDDEMESIYPIEAVMQVDLGEDAQTKVIRLDSIIEREELKGIPAIIQLRDIMIPYSEDSTIGKLQTIFYYGIPSRIQLESGNFPGFQNAKSGVVVGRAEKKLIQTDENGESYIYLERYEKIPVTGIIGSQNSKYQDRFLMADYDALPDSIRKKFVDRGNLLELHIQMEEKENIDDTVQKIAGIIRKKLPEASITAKVVVSEKKGFVSFYDSHVQFTLWIYAFCICIFLVVSHFWIREREKEIAIRKAFGMNGWQIGKLLIRDICSITLITIFLYMMIHYTGCIIFPEKILRWRVTFQTIIVFCGFLITTIVFCVTVPIWKCRKVYPAVLLNEKE